MKGRNFEESCGAWHRVSVGAWHRVSVELNMRLLSFNTTKNHVNASQLAAQITGGVEGGQGLEAYVGGVSSMPIPISRWLCDRSGFGNSTSG